MKKRAFFSLLISCLLQYGFSQPLLVQGDKGKLYLTHKVVARENWYSVGRLYNISPKEIAPFNNTTLTTPLTIGLELKIPLTEVNFAQTAEKNADESLVPVYHVLQPGETLGKICTAFNDLPLSTLETWNNIRKENTRPGSRLIIGYLKVKTSLSTLAKNAKEISPVATNKPTVTEQLTNQPVTTVENKKTVAPPDKKQLVSPPDNTGSLAENNAAPRNSRTTYRGENGGYFIGEYTQGSKSASGTAGTFKSTSGWQDGKYYALMNNVQVGTIVKVIAPATQKSVYAKVLGQLPDMKESEGLTIRISNAAASELGEPEGKFSVQVRY